MGRSSPFNLLEDERGWVGVSGLGGQARRGFQEGPFGERILTTYLLFGISAWHLSLRCCIRSLYGGSRCFPDDALARGSNDIWHFCIDTKLEARTLDTSLTPTVLYDVVCHSGPSVGSGRYFGIARRQLWARAVSGTSPHWIVRIADLRQRRRGSIVSGARARTWKA